MNVGIVGFVIGLAQRSESHQTSFLAHHGHEHLLAIVVYLVRLQRTMNSWGNATDILLSCVTFDLKFSPDSWAN